MGAGFLASKPDGSLLGSFSSSCFSASPLQSEIRAIHQAIRWAIIHRFNAAHIYSDCLNAILQIGGQMKGHFADTFLIQTLAQDISQLSFFRITNVTREVIHPAHVSAEVVEAATLSASFPYQPQLL